MWGKGFYPFIRALKRLPRPHVGATLFLILVMTSRAGDGVSGTFKYDCEVSKMWHLKKNNYEV